MPLNIASSFRYVGFPIPGQFDPNTSARAKHHDGAMKRNEKRHGIKNENTGQQAPKTQRKAKTKRNEIRKHRATSNQKLTVTKNETETKTKTQGTRHPKLKTGGKPSTWLPPGSLEAEVNFTKNQF